MNALAFVVVYIETVIVALLALNFLGENLELYLKIFFVVTKIRV